MCLTEMACAGIVSIYVQYVEIGTRITEYALRQLCGGCLQPCNLDLTCSLSATRRHLCPMPAVQSNRENKNNGS